MELSEIALLDRDSVLGDIFYTSILSYYGLYTSISEVAAVRQNAQHYLAAGLGSVGTEPSVDMVFGIPRTIAPDSIITNLVMARIVGVDDVGGSLSPQAARADFNFSAGLLSSVLEHEILDQQFATVSPGSSNGALSAVKAIGIASAQGQRVYLITQNNLDSALAAINLDSPTEQEIRLSVLSGNQVLTHENLLATDGSGVGAGYIIYDPVTGDGAFKISGGTNGADLIIGAFVGGILAIAGLYLAGTALFAALGAFVLLLGGSLLFNSALQSYINGTFNTDAAVAVSTLVGLLFLPFITGASIPVLLIAFASVLGRLFAYVAYKFIF